MKRLGAAVLAAVLVAGCGGSDHTVTTHRSTTTRHRSTTTAVTTTTTSPAPASSTAPTAKPATTNATTAPAPDRLKLTPVATLDQPVALAVRAGEPGSVYIAQQGGVVRRLGLTATGASVDPTPVLDISGRIVAGGEQGLLGITFSPDGNTLYADYTDTNGDTKVVAYPFSAGRATAAGEKQILFVDQPYPNHNGGQVNFGPDGLLYIALGDGGSGGDPQNHAQDRGSLLGKILRVNPNPTGGYSVPGDNPFVHTAGARPEIWHYGLRNPWRWSFDRATGEQWIGDVGQDAYEEIDHVAAGRRGVNFGWNRREGKHPYNGGATPSGAVDPEIETTHAAGNCAIVGGYVYRGSVIRGLAGTYLFSDNCNGRIVAVTGGVARDAGISVQQPSSFGEDASGELWILSLKGPVFRLERSA